MEEEKLNPFLMAKISEYLDPRQSNEMRTLNPRNYKDVIKPRSLYKCIFNDRKIEIPKRKMSGKELIEFLGYKTAFIDENGKFTKCSLSIFKGHDYNGYYHDVKWNDIIDFEEFKNNPPIVEITCIPNYPG